MKNNQNKKFIFSSLGTMLTGELICILLMFLVFSFVGNNITGLLLSELICVFLFYGIIYSSFWAEGDDDRNKVNLKKAEKNLLKGLKVGLILSIPQLIMNILLMLEKLNLSFSFIGIYKILNAHLWPLFNALTSTGQNKAPYIIMNISNISWSAILIVTSTIIILPALSSIAYILGYKGITLKQKIVYKK